MSLDEKLRSVLEHLRSLPSTRERALAITKLEECAFWAACAVEGVTSPIDYAVVGKLDA